MLMIGIMVTTILSIWHIDKQEEDHGQCWQWHWFSMLHLKILHWFLIAMMSSTCLSDDNISENWTLNKMFQLRSIQNRNIEAIDWCLNILHLVCQKNRLRGVIECCWRHCKTFCLSKEPPVSLCLSHLLARTASSVCQNCHPYFAPHLPTNLPTFALMAKVFSNPQKRL